MSFDNRGK